MRAIDRKLLRDLWGMRGQALAIAFVVLAGVATFIAMRSVMAALQKSLADYYQEYRFADGFASLRRAPTAVRQRLAAVPGIARVETRVVAPVTLEVPGFAESVPGLITSVPAESQPALNRLVLRSGRLVRAGRVPEVLLNEVFAEAHGLGPGDRLEATVNGRRRTLSVAGTALSPEYLLQIQPGTLNFDPQRYAILWMEEGALAGAYDMEGAFNDVAFTLAAGASAEDVLERVDQVLSPFGGRGAILRADQLSNFAISEEFRQLRGTSTLLPLVFILVAAFLLNIVVSRLISLQREQIGVLKAFGYGNAAIGAHYAKLVLLIALIGGGAGTAVGLWLGQLMGDLYLTYYRLPALYRATVMERIGLQRLFDQPTRMILRNLDRQPARALLTLVGIASACAILIMGLFFRDSMEYMIRAQYGFAQREDLAVTFVEPASGAALHELARLPGVSHAEPFRMVPVRLRFQHRRWDGGIEGVSPGAYLHRPVDERLRPIAVQPGGILLTDRLALKLGVREGDLLAVEVREGSRRTHSVPVAGIASQFIGLAAYMDLATLNRLAGTGHAISGAYLLTDERHRPAIAAALEERPRVASSTSQERAIAAFQEEMDRSMLTATLIMSLAAAVIAFGVVYNSARIALSERDRELASLRVLGFTRGEIAYILLGELTILTLAAIPVGMVLGAIAAAGLTVSLQTDMYQFPMVLGRGTLGLSAAVVLGAALLSAIIVRYRLDRLDLVGVLKTRE